DEHPHYFPSQFIVDDAYSAALDEAKTIFPLQTAYQTWQFIAQEHISFLSTEQREALADIRKRHQLSTNILQQSEAIRRQAKIEDVLKAISGRADNPRLNIANQIDKLLLRLVWASVIFFLLLFLVFQLVFILFEPIMDGIDEYF